MRENADQDDTQQKEQEERECCLCDPQNIDACETLNDEQVEPYRGRELAHFDDNYEVDAEPQRVEAHCRYHRHDDGRGQNDDRDPVEETTQHDEKDRQGKQQRGHR